MRDPITYKQELTANAMYINSMTNTNQYAFMEKEFLQYSGITRKKSSASLVTKYKLVGSR